MRRIASLLAALAAAAWLVSEAGCQAECSYDTDCPGAQVCQSGRCVVADTHLGQLGLCNAQSDCAPYEKCVNGSCIVPRPDDGGTPDGGTDGGNPNADCPAPPPADACAGHTGNCPCYAGSYYLTPGASCQGYQPVSLTVAQSVCQVSVTVGGTNFTGAISATGDVSLSGGAFTCSGTQDSKTKRITLTCGPCILTFDPLLPAAPSAQIPTGPFLMGTDDSTAPSDTQPQHQVGVTCFRMDEHEVTNRYYYECVRAPTNYTGTPCPLPAGATAPTDLLNPAIADLPVEGVTYADAVDYCAFRSQLLPTEAEWEKAARGACSSRGAPACEPGTDDPAYPWGNDASGVCTAPDDRFQECLVAPDTGPAPASGFTAGASVYGVLNMAGNVREWVRDAYQSDYYGTQTTWSDPQGPSPLSHPDRVIRGGSWQTSASQGKVYLRAYGDPALPATDASLSDVGFRCVTE